MDGRISVAAITVMLRSFSIRLLSLVLVINSTVSSQEHAADKDAVSIQTASPQSPSDDGPKSTTFNGVEVPPLKELTGENYETETKDGYWYVARATASKRRLYMSHRIKATRLDFGIRLGSLSTTRHTAVIARPSRQLGRRCTSSTT